MTKITVATFNCENLFRRYRFSTKAKPEKIANAVQNGFILDKSLFQTITEPERAFTAKAILDTKADIIGLVEVENLDTLRNFVSTHLSGKGYKFNVLIDGNDPRLIDVAIISKVPFDHVVTHQFVKNSKKRALFSRDCFEVKFTIEGKPLSIFVNHFKSMLDKDDPKNGRQNTAPRRIEQSKGVVEILKSRFGNDPGNANWVVMGDLNDYPSPDCSLNDLIDYPWINNVIASRLPANERWTHYWDTRSVPSAERYKQIDYLLLSRKLADASPAELPTIVRKGLCLNAAEYTGPRYPGIGKSNPCASDHCPVAITLEL